MLIIESVITIVNLGFVKLHVQLFIVDSAELGHIESQILRLISISGAVILNNLLYLM